MRHLHLSRNRVYGGIADWLVHTGLCDSSNSLSAVDTETDREIRRALDRERPKDRRVTTFIISHRITTLADADLILVLENGRIAEMGTHDQLIAGNGLYRRVYRIQAALEDEFGSATA